MTRKKRSCTIVEYHLIAPGSFCVFSCPVRCGKGRERERKRSQGYYPKSKDASLVKILILMHALLSKVSSRILIFHIADVVEYTSLTLFVPFRVHVIFD